MKNVGISATKEICAEPDKTLNSGPQHISNLSKY